MQREAKAGPDLRASLLAVPLRRGNLINPEELYVGPTPEVSFPDAPVTSRSLGYIWNTPLPQLLDLL